MMRSTGISMGLSVCVLAGCADVVSVPLLGDATYPEGIAAHAGTNQLFVGGLANGDIQRIDARGDASYFKEANEDGLLNVVGLAVDPDRDRLFVCSTSFADPTVLPSLVVFDTETGEQIASLSAPADGLPHFFNDVTVDRSGRAYVTDSFAPVVYAVDVDLTSIDVLASDPAFVVDPSGFNLNGIAVTTDDRFAIVSVATLGGVGRLFRIGLGDGEAVLPSHTRSGRSFGPGGLIQIEQETTEQPGGHRVVSPIRVAGAGVIPVQQPPG
ncbi:MAG: hypothetical protein AAF602_13320, partial [Myxococcota bacterium]